MLGSNCKVAPFINGHSNLQLQVGAAPFMKGATLQLEPNIYIAIMIFSQFWNNVMYTYVLELRFVLAASCKSIPHVFLIIFHLYMILNDICILLHHIYKRIIPEQHKWNTFITLTILGQSNLPGDIHHPDVGS